MIFFFFSYLPLDLLVSFTHLGLSIFNKIFRYLKSLITLCFSCVYFLLKLSFRYLWIILQNRDYFGFMTTSMLHSTMHALYSNLLCMLHFYFYLHFLLHASCSVFAFTFISCSMLYFYFHASFFIHDYFAYFTFMCMVTLHA